VTDRPTSNTHIIIHQFIDT